MDGLGMNYIRNNILNDCRLNPHAKLATFSAFSSPGCIYSILNIASHWLSFVDLMGSILTKSDLNLKNFKSSFFKKKKKSFNMIKKV